MDRNRRDSRACLARAAFTTTEKVAHSIVLDATGVLIGRELRRLNAPSDSARPEPKPIEGLVREVDGKYFLNVTLDELWEERDRSLRGRDTVRIR